MHGSMRRREETRPVGKPRGPGASRRPYRDPDAHHTLAQDDDQERGGRRLLLGEGAVLAHRLARRLAAEMHDDQQS
jgi:hypothetical protein